MEWAEEEVWNDFILFCFIFFTGDNGIALVVEGAREDLVCMPFQDLQTISRIGVPQPGHLVAAGRQNTRALRVETRLKRRRQGDERDDGG